MSRGKNDIESFRTTKKPLGARRQRKAMQLHTAFHGCLASSSSGAMGTHATLAGSFRRGRAATLKSSPRPSLSVHSSPKGSLRKNQGYFGESVTGERQTQRMASVSGPAIIPKSYRGRPFSPRREGEALGAACSRPSPPLQKRRGLLRVPAAVRVDEDDTQSATSQTASALSEKWTASADQAASRADPVSAPGTRSNSLI